MDTRSLPAFDPIEVFRVLDRHAVRVVVIGGIAGRLWGSPTVTNDLDVCYAREPANLEALAAALVDLEARLRGVPEDVPFVPDGPTLKAGDHFTLVTRAGNLDCLGTSAGLPGFDPLWRTATRMDVGGFTVRVAALRDLIAMKLAAGRPKDLIEVEVLRALEEEIDASAGPPRRQRRPDQTEKRIVRTSPSSTT